MKHTDPKMQKRLESLTDKQLRSHLRAFKGDLIAEVAEFLLSERSKTVKKVDKVSDMSDKR